jgi:predicted GNAT family N-acyltransferase
MEYELSWDPKRLQFDRVHTALAGSYWSPNVSREIVERAAANSLVLGAYRQDDGEQIAYARVITDRATLAYLCDVIVFDGHRKSGVGKALVSAILAHPDLQTVRRFLLATQDAHGLYAQYGFGPVVDGRWMELRNASATC